MKAIVLHARGGAGQLSFEETSLPVLQQGDVLLKVSACAITRNELKWGPTYTNEKGESRLPSIPGHECSGIVQSVAPGVSGISVGDAVYGLTSFFRNGAAAEYAAIKADELALKPASLGFIPAAAVPLAALTAWQGLFDHGHLKPGQKVLIHGAAGGVGSFAIQLARWCGSEVIASSSPENHELLMELGATSVIDSQGQRFEENIRDIDLVFDTVGGDTQARSWKVIKPGGSLVTIAGESIDQPPAYKEVKGIFFIVKSSREQLNKLTSLIDSNQLRPIIAMILPLSQARQAYEKAEKADAKRGKIVLQID